MDPLKMKARDRRWSNIGLAQKNGWMVFSSSATGLRRRIFRYVSDAYAGCSTAMS
jgi:hypothetical protein